jgi:fatty acid desaturase
MVLKSICPPALIYLVFSITQVAIDTMRGMYNLAFVKIWVAMIFTILLNYLCLSGLGVISWIIVFIPFILMTIIVSMLLVMFGLDPLSGKKMKRRKKRHHHKAHVIPQPLSPSKHSSNDKKHRHHLPSLTQKDERALALAERLAKRYNLPEITTYGESKISSDEKKVLNDMVRRRTNLSSDPLQKKKITI